MIVNEKPHVPTNILITKLGLRNSLVMEFLDTITTKGWGNGVKRQNYYIVNVNGILRIPNTLNPKLITIFVKFIEACQMKGYDLLMINI